MRRQNAGHGDFMNRWLLIVCLLTTRVCAADDRAASPNPAPPERHHPSLLNVSLVFSAGGTNRPANSSATPATARAERPWVNSLGMEFVPVPKLGVLFATCETRVQDFEKFVNATGYDATEGMCSLKSGIWGPRGDTWKSPGFPQNGAHAVVGVSWRDAKAYCEWLTRVEREAGLIQQGQEYRLPTDKEWSAAIGLPPEMGDTPKDRTSILMDIYPWGVSWPPPAGVGNYAGSEAVDEDWVWKPIANYTDGYPRTAPVGSFAAGKFGLHDMGGNVWEWCEDWYDARQRSRVARGGSWSDCGSGNLLSSFRIAHPPSIRTAAMGFRCVLPVSP